MGSVRRLTWAAAVVMATRCAPGPPLLDEDEPRSPPVTPSRTLVDLGSVRPATWAWSRVRFENSSSEPVTLAAPEGWPPCASDHVGWCAAHRAGHWNLQSPTRVEPGGFVRAQLGFRSDGWLWEPASLRVETCEDPSCAAEVGFRVTAGHRSLECTPSLLDFGPLPPASIVSRNLYCTVLSRPAELIAGPLVGTFRRGPGQVRIVDEERAVFEVQARLPSRPGTFEDELKIRSRFFDPARITVRAEGAPLTPCEIETSAPVRFAVERGAPPPEMAVTVANPSDRPCVLSSARLLPEPKPSSLRLRFGDENDLRLRPGETMRLPLTFETSEVEALDRTLRIEAGGEVPSVDVRIRGEVRDGTRTPDLDPIVVPEGLDFGASPLSCGFRPRTIIVYNGGRAEMTVAAAELGGDPDFWLRSPRPVFPLVSGQSHAFDFSFHPEQLGPRRATFRLELTAADQSTTREIPLLGTGLDFEERQDEFQIFPPPAIDTLILADPTLPSGEAARFASIASELPGRSLHFGVTTTAVGPRTTDGRILPLEGPNRVLSSDALGASLPEVLAERLEATTSTAPSSEAGLEAQYRALSAPRIFEANRGFLRRSSLLAAIFLSSRTDTSPRSENIYLNHFLSIRFSRLDIQRIFVVGGPPEGCQGRVDAAPAGAYRDVAERLDPAVFISICEADAPARLAEAIRAWSGPHTLFFLTSDPVSAESIEVSLDDAPLPPVNAEGMVNWSYREDRVAVELSAPLARSRIGSTLRVRYPAECL